MTSKQSRFKQRATACRRFLRSCGHNLKGQFSKRLKRFRSLQKPVNITLPDLTRDVQLKQCDHRGQGDINDVCKYTSPPSTRVIWFFAQGQRDELSSSWMLRPALIPPAKKRRATLPDFYMQHDLNHNRLKSAALLSRCNISLASFC